MLFRSIDKYYVHEDGRITLRADGREKEYTVKTDIKRLGPINLFDLQSKFELRYDIIDNNGVKQHINHRISETKPLYEEGMCKDTIKKLFYNV